MAKGVKSLKMTDGRYYPGSSRVNRNMVIKADLEAVFEVDEWHPGTTAEEKSKILTWFWFDENKKLITKDAGRRFRVTVPKRLCGSYTYYLEASLSGNFDMKSGIYIRGLSDLKIKKSKWCLVNDGDDQRSHKFSFGENVFLGLETEGIDGKWVTVELYRLNSEITLEKVSNWLSNKKYDPTKDDVIAKVFEKQAHVINGEINTDFTLLPSWKKGHDDNKFYVKIRDGNKYISDDHGDYIHARYLTVKNKIVPTQTEIKILSSNAPVKVGDTEKKASSISQCRFQILKLTERNKTVELFNEGRFINKMDSSSKFYTIRNINYDYDKSNIRNDAKPVLDEIVQFLTKLMPYVPVELGSHTDVRGTNEYNVLLSQRRAQAVVDYLIKNGVDPNRIHAKGYGKSKPLFIGENISEAMHEQNRRTTIKFLISDKEAVPIQYSLIAPNMEKPLPISIAVNGFSRKGCYHSPQKHKNEMSSVDGYKLGSRNTLKDGDNLINYKVYSPTPALSDFLHSFFLGSRFAHQFFINSCAYYSKVDVKNPKPTLLLTTYPDAVLTYNIRMDYKEPYFWNDVPVNIVNNFIWLDETVASVKDSLSNLKAFSTKEINDLSDKIFEFIDEETHKMGIGMHFIYNFDDIENRKSPSKTYDYTQEYRNATAVALVIMYLIEIAIILLILWFTRGKGAFGRIKKFRPFFKAVDKLDDMGFEVDYPKMAENRSMYFESSLGKISRVVEVNSKADPLLGISYSKEVSLMELGETSERLKKVLGKETLENTKLKFEFKGKIFCEFNVKINLGSKKIFVKDFLFGLNSFSGKFTAGVGIAAGASLKGFKIQKEKSIRILPIFPPKSIKFEAKLDVDLGGYITYSRNYGIDYGLQGKATGIYYQDVIFFSGLKGTLHQRVLTQVEDETVFDTNAEDKPTSFTLINGDTYYLDKVYLLKI